MKTSKGLLAGFWISTVLFALQMGFTAYAQLRLPQVAADNPAIAKLILVSTLLALVVLVAFIANQGQRKSS